MNTKFIIKTNVVNYHVSHKVDGHKWLFFLDQISTFDWYMVW